MKHFYRKKESININIKSLYENHIKVIERYDFGDEEIYQMMDRFIPQIIEEVYEFNEEIQSIIEVLDANGNNIQEVLSDASLELLDIILYLVSINSTLIKNYDISFLDLELKFDEDFILNDGISIYDKSKYKKSSDIISKLVNNTLGFNRRICPNRKYHKPKEEISNEHNKAVIINIFKSNHLAILTLLELLFGGFVLAKDVDKVLNKVQDVVKNK